MSLPAGYARVVASGAETFAWHEAAAWLEEAMADGSTLYGWAGRQPLAQHLAGRAPVRVVSAPARGPEGRERWAVRSYVRGGAVRALGDRHLAVGTPRPLRELAASVEARARGVPTPAVVAGSVHRSGAVYRADLVTELVPHARSLAATLFEGVPRGDANAALRLAGRLVRTLAEAGVLHRDLNAHNVLLVEGVQGAEAWVVDLDRCGLTSKGGLATGAMGRRLVRSLRKLGASCGRALGEPEWAALLSGLEDRP